MKIKLIIVLILVLPKIVEAQLNQIEIGVNIIPTYYKNSNPDLLNYAFYEGDMANKFTLVKSINLDYMITKNIGIQIGFQQHDIKLENNEYILEYVSGGFETIITKNYDSSIKLINKHYEIPVSLILEKLINEKINLSLLLGGSRMRRSRTKYEITNKVSGESDNTESKFKKAKVISNFSPQAQFRIQFKVLDRLNVSNIIFMKSTKIDNFDKIYLGAGIGLSYILK